MKTTETRYLQDTGFLTPAIFTNNIELLDREHLHIIETQTVN